jgi:CheY-like chemotaxis protein
VSLTDADRQAVFEAFARDAQARADTIELEATALEEAGDAGGRRRAGAALAEEAHKLRGAAAIVQLRQIQALAIALDFELNRYDPAQARAESIVVSAARRLVEPLRALSSSVASPEETDEPVEAGVAAKFTILHIEDNASNRKLVERILSLRPLVGLVEAQDGETGLSLAREIIPSLVLLDLRLPDMSGEEVLRRLRLEPATRNVPVVLISAEARPEVTDRLLAAGADEFVVKPIDIESLLEVVDRTLAKVQP